MTQNAIPHRAPLSRRIRIGAAAIGLLAVGGVAGTVASHALQPPIEMAPLRPVSIVSLPKTDGIITIRGRVTETYGNKFVIDDGSARTLVDTGREGDGHALVTIGAPFTVQGRFDRGFVRASFLVDQAGKVTSLRPMGGPMDGPPHGHRGPPPPRPDAADWPTANAAPPSPPTDAADPTAH